MGYEMTKKELAQVAGYTYRRLHDIDTELPENRKLFVKTGDGNKCDLCVFVQRWVAFNVAREVPEDVDLEVVKAKHEIVKTEKTELEVARMKGQLIDVQDVKNLWGNVINTAVQKFVHVSAKVAPSIRMMDNVEQIAEIIDEEIRRVLEELSTVPLPEYAAEDIEEEIKSEEGENE